MHFTHFLPILAATAIAAPVEGNVKRAGGCSSYTIINTRGTGELQGQSSGFRSMNSKIQSQVPGGKIYNTVYMADFSQVSTMATADIVRQVNNGVKSNPDQCYVLEGYSQGAAATTNALSQLTGASFDAVKAVFLIGNPLRKRGLACNVDNKGGETTKNVQGMMALIPGAKSIPEEWQSKTLDVCIFGDGVCDTTHGIGINMQHLSYPMDSSTQTMGTEFVVKQLTA